MDTHDQYALRPGSERRLHAIQRAFRALRASYDWRIDSWRAPWRRLQRLRYWLLPALIGAGLGLGAVSFLDMSERFGDAGLAARHILAAPGCAAAHAVGLAPARRGSAGYYPSHDRDDDGIACELYRP